MNLNLKLHYLILILFSALQQACNTSDTNVEKIPEKDRLPEVELLVEEITDTISPLLVLHGSVGSAPIEMEILRSDSETGSFEGRYRYQDKADYLKIKGKILGNCYHIEEFYENEQTGSFILQRIDMELTGVWFSDIKYYETKLVVFAGDTSAITKRTLQELSENVSSSIFGTYSAEHYYINDFYVSEEDPAYEVGFSGGDIVISETGDETIYFKCELVIGPTAHLAIAEGFALPQGDIYIYTEDVVGNGPCIISFEFSEKAVHVKANSNSNCGFGAQAYIDHYFIKTKDPE